MAAEGIASDVRRGPATGSASLILLATTVEMYHTVQSRDSDETRDPGQPSRREDDESTTDDRARPTHPRDDPLHSSPDYGTQRHGRTIGRRRTRSQRHRKIAVLPLLRQPPRPNRSRTAPPIHPHPRRTTLTTRPRLHQPPSMAKRSRHSTPRQLIRYVPTRSIRRPTRRRTHTQRHPRRTVQQLGKTPRRTRHPRPHPRQRPPGHRPPTRRPHAPRRTRRRYHTRPHPPTTNRPRTLPRRRNRTTHHREHPTAN
jgi:hypothetical protein